MIQCNECGTPQLEGALFCSECGRFLVGTSRLTTAVLPFAEYTHRHIPSPLATNQLETDGQKRRVTFVIPGSRRRIAVETTHQIRVGRADLQADLTPELDLTGDNGAEKGVSRMHATIQTAKEGLVLIDLNSTNGTMLNNYRLQAERPYPLRSGDEIRFGDLLVHLFFE